MATSTLCRARRLGTFKSDRAPGAANAVVVSRIKDGNRQAELVHHSFSVLGPALHSKYESLP
jgi:hypothetical protein